MKYIEYMKYMKYMEYMEYMEKKNSDPFKALESRLIS